MRNNIETIKNEEKKAAIDNIFSENNEFEVPTKTNDTEDAFIPTKATKKANEIWGEDFDESANNVQ